MTHRCLFPSLMTHKKPFIESPVCSYEVSQSMSSSKDNQFTNWKQSNKLCGILWQVLLSYKHFKTSFYSINLSLLLHKVSVSSLSFSHSLFLSVYLEEGRASRKGHLQNCPNELRAPTNLLILCIGQKQNGKSVSKYILSLWTFVREVLESNTLQIRTY